MDLSVLIKKLVTVDSSRCVGEYAELAENHNEAVIKMREMFGIRETTINFSLGQNTDIEPCMAIDGATLEVHDEY